MSAVHEQRVILASPTKDFFIDMLVKDIELIPAIVDLLDNAVDGARRTRGGEQFDGLWVRIEASSERLEIKDNCGGIPVDLARDYAFRFGRPADMPRIPHSVGEFGVGMKRALFKLGKRFRIESTAKHSRFVLKVDEDDWQVGEDPYGRVLAVVTCGGTNANGAMLSSDHVTTHTRFRSPSECRNELWTSCP
jgi:hypothetical protein